MNTSGLQHYLSEIRNLVSCPPKIYSQLYLSTLSQFIALNSINQTKERLALSIAVLKIRRGILLPKNAGAEAIAAEEAQWTYALFSASLLKKIASEKILVQIIPKVAEQWLENNAYLYKQWKETLWSDRDKVNDLNVVISRALEITQIQFL